MKVQVRVTKLVEQCDYVSIDQVRNYLEGEHVSFSDGTIKEYLYRLQRKNVVYDAGRGWYSTIEQPYQLKTGPVEELIEDMNDRFPFLEFCVWSTRQIASHYHHLPTKFHYFIYTEKNQMDAIYDYLVTEGENAYQNPRKPNKKHFETTEETYIVRPSISKQPCHDHLATIEKLLVDLYKEKEDLNFLSGREYIRIFENIVGHWRIQASKLISYANRRGVRENLIPMLSDFPPNNGSVTS